MRTVSYEQHEFHCDPVARHAELSAFVYDIPWFAACGIFPPHHIANEIFESGGGDGGMGPGTTWEPFRLTEAEYEELVKVIRKLDPETLSEKVRFGEIRFEFDAEFDSETSWVEWINKVCEKHRDAWHKKRFR